MHWLSWWLQEAMEANPVSSPLQDFWSGAGREGRALPFLAMMPKTAMQLQHAEKAGLREGSQVADTGDTKGRILEAPAALSSPRCLWWLALPLVSLSWDLWYLSYCFSFLLEVSQVGFPGFTTKSSDECNAFTFWAVLSKSYKITA